jgi:S-adenosylmethionine synthetase
MRDFILTSESVTAGHPDKLCDQISDAIVDACLAETPPAAVNAECAVSNGVVFLTVRREGRAHPDLTEIARSVIAEVGYVEGSFAARSCTVLTTTSLIDAARPDNGARAAHAATVFGYACSQTPERMPYPIWCAHRLTRTLDEARRSGQIPYLMPDGQAQVAVSFRDRQPVAIHSLVLTTAVAEGAPGREAVLRNELIAAVIEPAFADSRIGVMPSTRIMTLRAAPSPIGGPSNHAGLTGRKAGDDSYGSYVRQSSAALSGKDPSRIDRTAAYAARHLAKCVVVADLATECEVQLSYAIGDEDPVSLEVDSFGTGRIADSQISSRLREVFDLRVGAIAERLGLWQLSAARGGRFYRDLAVYGHFGRHDLSPPWEDTSAAAGLA